MDHASQAVRHAAHAPAGVPAQDDGPEDVPADDGTLALMDSRQVHVSERIKAAAHEVNEKEGPEKIKNWTRGFCRLAMFCENRRMPIRREDVTKKIFESDKTAIRCFPVIFWQAQKQLRKIFAMELVPLRQRGKENEALARQKEELQATQAGTAPTQQRAEASPDTAKAWIVRSVLPPKLRQEMMEGSRRVAREVGPSSDTARALEQMRPGDPEGCVVDWQRADAQLGSMGLLYLVLGLILLSGRELPDGKLRAYLAKMGLTRTTILPRALRPDDTYATGQPGAEQSSLVARITDASPHTVEDWLEVLTKQQYLEIENKQATITGQRQRRTHSKRKGRGDDFEPADPGEDMVWKWGGRADVEIGEEAAANFIAEVMEDGVAVTAATATANGTTDEPVAPDGRRHQRIRATQLAAPQLSLHDSLMTSVERAVGSQFVS